MATTEGDKIRTVADIFTVLTDCTSAEANRAEHEICKSPEALAMLAQACSISTGAIALGGVVTVGGLVLKNGVIIIGGVVLIGAGLKGAQKFCHGFLNQSLKSVDGVLINEN